MLEPFQTAHAAEIAGWPTSAEEARRWGGHATPWPVAASAFDRWHDDPDVHAYVLVEAGELLGYGEVWVDQDEREVELGRVIVRPQRRGQGLGRLLVGLLLQRVAQTGYPTAFVRVAPDNAAALACYAGAGFAAVTPDERRRFNEGQPVAYAWLRRELS
jgi:ribosomal-protein-alanine N-acetyltransferase